ncbi:immunoglobulin superfamily member 10 [Gymnodraco acuticeps]|uniref:immunoglobulin superfamily member 10 n=1 Tax=Gymnodraco acuticeps TaxID=8218 RepID=UPI001471965E|nr:immunoglobulin superfamily member 10 [Gymnodraco acuticeps]XP_034085229.1 immunoglobulin superfamily member 10 [Gymnodraco acuticeps]
MRVCGCSAPNLRRFLLRALLFLAAVLPTSGDCPKSCACNVPTEVHCTFRYLTAIPDHIQPAVERINLGYNSITVLRENDLSGLGNLELLMLHSNTIHSIDDRAFQDLKSLQVLKVSFNKVKEIRKETFKGLDSLLRLHIDHNNIEFISPEAFYGLTRLQLVHLEGNHLQQLHPDTFITLRHSQVFKISSMRNIHLSDNLLTTLPEGIFSGCSQLENLFLHGNPWTCDCRMKWFSVWVQRNTGVLKCKRDRRYPRGQLCPVCESPAPYHNRPLSLLPGDAFTCTKPWIQPHLKKKNISLDEGDYTPVSPKDFIAPLGSIQLKLTDQLHSDASLSCTVQRPSALENLTQTLEEGEGNNATMLTASISTYLVCNIDHEHIQQLWQMLATYSDSALRLERGLMLTRSPEMVYRYSQMKKTNEGEEGIYTNIEAEIKASPAWLMQGEVSFQLDRTTTTFSTLHIKYESVVNLRVENTSPKKDRYSWTMIKRDNKTQTEYTVLTGGVVQLSCQIQGEPKPLLEWILPDRSKVRAPFSSDDRRIIITAEGKLTLRGADASDTGLYRCITTNYLDADVLVFRVAVLSPDVEESDVNGVQLSQPLGENLFFDCSSSGSPEASVQWILPDHSVVGSSHGNRKVYDNGTLLVNGLTARDSGFYRCLVSNHLGFDLLVSQVTVTGETSERVTVLDSEGSGLEMEDKVYLSLTENTDTLNEIPSSRPSDGTSQESRTITSDRPYPRLRSQVRVGAGGRLGKKRKGPVSNRRIWSNRVFDKSSRKVDPQKFAEFMKKAQDGLRIKAGAEEEGIQYDHLNTILSGDGEIGSGEGHSENHLPRIVKAATENPQKGMMIGQENRLPETITTTHAGQDSNEATMEAHQTFGTETTVNNPIDSSHVTENTNTLTTESYMQSDSTPIKSTFTHNPSEKRDTQSDAATPHSTILLNTGLSSVDDTTDLYAKESTSKPGSNRHPVTLQLTVTDTSQETQLQFSGGQPAESETSTGTSLSFTTDPHVTPMMDGPGPLELIVHTSTDPESQTTFTAVSTTERHQDEITFHTTQTIKSPNLPPGSTIISRQQIQIIPNKNSRGGGRRRIFNGRRRVIKPNRITDIQSFINKVKQPSVKKEGNSTVPYRIELTAACDWDEDKKKTETTDLQMVTPKAPSDSSLHMTERPSSAASTTNYYITSNSPFTHTESKSEVSSGYITSADEESISSTTTTTIASNVIRGRIPWNRLFGGRERENIHSRLKKPLNTKKNITTVDTTTVTPTTTPAALPTTTANFLSDPETESPSRHTEGKKGSLDDDYGDVTSAVFELTTLQPSFHHLTTPSTHYTSKSVTTAETPPKSQTLPSPPPVKLPLIENTDEDLSSGSGGLPDNLVVFRQTPGGTRRQKGRRRRPFRGRRPFKKPAITTLNPTSTTTMETTTLPQHTFSPYNPLYTPSRKEDRTPVVISAYQTSKEETDLYEEFDWSTSSSLPAFTTTKTPLILSTALTPTTSFMPITTKKWPYTTARTEVQKTPIQSNTGHATLRPPVRKIRPTVLSSGASDIADKELDAMTDEQGPYNNKGPHYDNLDRATGNEATRANTAGFEPTTNIMTNKPKIVGGNAASFTVLSNSDAFLPCEAVGNPEPAITWKRFSSTTGNIVTVKGKMGKFEVLSNGTLFIQNANIKDRGQYICLAENDYGSDKLFVTLSVVAYPSRILEPKIREIKSHAGNTVEMKCRAEGRPLPMLSWILANRTQVKGQNTEKGRVSVSADGTLVIEEVSVYDRGNYKCIASNPAGADTATVRLQVVASPPGIVEEKRQQVKVGVNQHLWLPCTGQGSPQPAIHWVLNDGSMVQSNRPASRISVYGNGTLHIKDVTPKDSGKFECIATSSTGSERRVVTLTVERQESAPQIVETSQRVTVLFFEDQLRLNCSATGDPKPQILWRLPSKAIVDQEHRMGSRIQVLDNGTLIVTAMSDKDAGDYLCVARNKIGDDLHLMKVSVSMKAAKIEPKHYGKKKVPFGNDFKVDCKASGAPKPEISWGLPDGTVVSSALQSDASSGQGRARRYTLFDNGTLYLNQVSMSEEGDYTCYAENQVGKDEMHLHITVVTAAPRIRSTGQTYARVKPGGNIRFDCEALGEPKPKILWMLPTNDVIAASNERYLMHVNGSLDIRDVKLIDVGEYICMARNPAGENRKVYKLDMEGNPPVINGYRQNRTVIKDVAAKYSRKLIDCNADGDPMPSITWIMPDNIFIKAPYFGSRINVHHNGTLEIRNVRPTDTAEFICMARNDGGEAVMVVQLEVSSILRRPIFKNPFNERVVSRIGKTTVLNCSAGGYPMPEISWTLPNGTRLTSGHPLVKNGTLVIYNPSKENAGKYRCGAKNFMGYIEKLIILDVGQPYILTRPRGVIRSAAGEPLFIHCLSDGSPRPHIYWTIPGGHILTQPQVSGRFQVLQNGTLIVQDTTIHDQGNYICRARSSAGEAVLTVPVIIIAYPPRITTGPPSSVRGVTGTPIQLNCAAIGIPKPEIMWELPDHSVLSAADQGRPMGSELLHPQGTLIIQRPKASDSGTYKCQAKNHLGTDSKVTYVRIL